MSEGARESEREERRKVSATQCTLLESLCAVTKVSHVSLTRELSERRRRRRRQHQQLQHTFAAVSISPLSFNFFLLLFALCYRPMMGPPSLLSLVLKCVCLCVLVFVLLSVRLGASEQREREREFCFAGAGAGDLCDV